MRVLKGQRIGIIGAGNMGQALIKGLLAAGVLAQRIVAVEANRNTRLAVARRYAIRFSTVAHIAKRCQVVVVAVKPQDIRPVLTEIGRLLPTQHIAKRPLVISIAAGVKLAAIERILGRARPGKSERRAGVAVVRVMPNLAAKVGSAISAVASGRFATPSHRAVAKAIFQCVGEVVELPERLFDAVTAISGSGPAYFFVIFQALRDAGVAGGLPKPVAKRLAVQTALGSAQLVNGSREELEALIAQVASKKGTTEAALKVFRRRGLARVIRAGVLAATKRSKELSSHHLSSQTTKSPGSRRRGGALGFGRRRGN